jgi:hypothetical protein
MNYNVLTIIIIYFNIMIILVNLVINDINI